MKITFCLSTIALLAAASSTSAQGLFSKLRSSGSSVSDNTIRAGSTCSSSTYTPSGVEAGYLGNMYEGFYSPANDKPHIPVPRISESERNVLACKLHSKKIGDLSKAKRGYDAYDKIDIEQKLKLLIGGKRTEELEQMPKPMLLEFCVSRIDAPLYPNGMDKKWVLIRGKAADEACHRLAREMKLHQLLNTQSASNEFVAALKKVQRMSNRDRATAQHFIDYGYDNLYPSYIP